MFHAGFSRRLYLLMTAKPKAGQTCLPPFRVWMTLCSDTGTRKDGGLSFVSVLCTNIMPICGSGDVKMNSKKHSANLTLYDGSQIKPDDFPRSH